MFTQIALSLTNYDNIIIVLNNIKYLLMSGCEAITGCGEVGRLECTGEINTFLGDTRYYLNVVIDKTLVSQ